MRNFTLRKFNSFKLISFILFLLFSLNASAQFYTKHYIAPAPWQYFSKANEIVIATNSAAAVSITVAKSDGTIVTTLSASKGSPAVYRFTPLPKDAKAHPFNTVLNAAGLIVTGNAPISINLRNVASDALGGDGSDVDIKGNAALTSFGDAGIGVRFRVGYYRDGSLGNFNNYGDQRPIYSIMAITNGTTVTIGGAVTATLNAGQSYLFKAPIGTLVETSNPGVMNTSAFIDTPNGCGDGAFNQIPPESVLGSEYFIERGKGNDTAEQTTVIATKPNTKVIVDTYSVTGALVSTKTTTLATAGSFFTFLNGVTNTNFSASRVSADNNVVVYSGTAQSCEVDISTIAPVSECGGSKFIETVKFRNYSTGSLPYFGYVLLKDAVSKVYVNGVDIETKSGVSARHQLGATGWYLINFVDSQVGSPDILSISSDAKLTVSIVQQGGGFSMAGFFSNFAVQPEDPTLTYISGGGCTNSSAMLTTPSGFSPYQWFLNGTAISDATSNTYTATKTGSYSVSSTLTCGAQTQSKPITVTLCTDLGVTKTVNNATPCVGSNVEFTLTLSNLGVNNASGVSVNDVLPTGYTFVSSAPSVGIYNSGTGVWSIGDINGGVAATLKVVATVNASGVYTNTATIPGSVSDTNPANNSASVSTTPNPLPTVVITNPASVCAPSKVNITTAAITAGSTANLTFSYWTDAAATIAYSTPTAATAGTYYIKGTTASGCSDIKPVVVTTATAPNSGTLYGAQNICISGTTTFTSNGNSGGSWSSSDTTVAIVNASTGFITGAAAGTATITYKVTGTGGCNDANSTRNIIVNPIPTASITGILTACYTTTLTAVTNASPVAYVWYKDNVVISGQTASTLVVTADGDYKVKITNTATTCENTSAASTVKVSDTQKPTITCPSNVMAVADANSCIATGIVLGTPTTTDNCTGTITVTNNAPSSFPIGITTVTWTAKDAAGNTETCTQTVTVSDTQKPTITCPSNVTVVADANSCVTTGVVLGRPITTDNCTGTITVTNNAPSSFPIGITTVTWTATDAAGNTQTCTQTVTVSDTQKPTITCPSNVTAVADANSCTATGVVLGTPTTTDNCTETITVTNNAPSSFPIGITTVTWTATDAAGNTETCTQTVTVSDTQKPTITCPSNVTAVADANSCIATGVVLGTPTTTDNCTGTITVTNNAPSSFPIGVTTVTWTAMDAAGNTQTCTQTVTVSDTQKPTITCPSNVTAVADANSCTATGVVLGTPTTTDNCTETITVTNNAPSSFPIGITTVTWTATDAAGNMQTCTQTVKVVGPINANDDIVSSFNGYSGGIAVSHVLSNDFLNCSAVIASDVNLTLTGTLPSVLTFDVTNGSVKVNPHTPAGTYSFDYAICEKSNSTNCSTASVKITVVAPIIDAVTETTSSINGNVGGTTTELVITNDTLNGNPVVIGTNPGEVILTGITVPTGLTLNANGTVTVAPNTPAKDYEIEYSICEITNPTNCDVVKSIITVTSGILIANPDEIPSAIATNKPQTLVNVLDNDTNNGIAVVPNDLNLTIVTPDSKGFLTLNPDGTVTLDADAPAGTYEIVYQICEKLNPANCSSASVKVTVETPVINAVEETTTTVINGAVGGTTESLVANDTLNGNPVVIGTKPGNVTLSEVRLPTGFILNADGTVNVPANTPAGNYNLEYKICEVNNPTNCDNATSTIVVTGDGLRANPDVIPSVVESKEPQLLANVFDNDTNDGAAVIPDDLKLTIVKADPTGFLTLNTDGTATLGADAPAGTYELTYEICEKLSPKNCSQAIVRVKVNAVIPVTPLAPIVANNDAEVSVDGINGQLEFINILENDLLRGLPVNISDVVISNTPNPYFEFNADGTVNVLPNTPGGNYALAYQICEKANSTNCATATLNVFVEAPSIAIIKTAAFNDENKNGFANAGETITYKFKITNTGNVPLLKIMVTDLLPGIILLGDAVDLNENESDENSFTAVYKITQADINAGKVSNQASVQGKSERGVVVADKSDDTNNTEDKPTVLPLNGCQIEVLNALSPNGDQKNERFYIRGLECYPDNIVEIYNRWGVLVFDIDHYNNEDRAFVGLSAGRTTIKQSEGLPVGTYFYILKYRDSESNQHEKSGYLYINK